MLAVPPLCAFLIEHFGWRTAVLALAGISGVGLAMSAMLVRPAPRRSAPSLSEPFSLLIGSRAFVQIYISWVVGTTALFIALVFLPSFAVSRGADPVAASLLISAIGGASVLGRLGVGYAATDLRALFFYKTAVLAMAASYAIWLFLTDYNWLLVFASVLGIAYGVRIALVAPVLIALFGTNRLGGLLGTFFTATGIAGLAAPIAANLAVAYWGSDTGSILAAIVLGVISFVLLLSVNVTAKRRD